MPVRPRPWLRALAAAWLALAAAALAALGGELWLRLDRQRDVRASEAFRAASPFFAHKAALEAGARSLWQVPGQAYRPGARLAVGRGDERYEIAINSRGYRTREFAVPKPRGLVRVICIGGSTTVAGRRNDETYPARLERRLREILPGLPLEVLNLGVSGTTTAYWEERLSELLALEPDLVVQYQAVNDIAWRHFPRYAREHPWRARLYRSLLVQRLAPFPAASLDPYLRQTAAALARTAQAVRGSGAAYLGATFAAPDPARARGALRRHLDVDTASWTAPLGLHGIASWAAIVARHNRRYEALARRHGIPFVAVHRALDDPALFVDVCHLTPAGIERLAEAFAPAAAGTLRRSAAYRRRGPAR